MEERKFEQTKHEYLITMSSDRSGTGEKESKKEVKIFKE